jgi:short-subunit dehydrogenase
MSNIIIFGASRGLGAGLAEGIPQVGDTVWLVSRGRPPHLETADGITRHWLQVDLAQETAADQIAEALGRQRLDVIIYNAGIWESDAFSSNHQFEAVTAAENQRILTVNLLAAVHCLHALLPNVRQSTSGKIILIGSTSGLENVRGPEVAYTASKFGLRGVAHALRENLRADHVAVTCLNPGSLNTSTPLTAGVEAAGRARPDCVPMIDMVAIVRCLIQLSPYTSVKEMDIPAMLDPHV